MPIQCSRLRIAAATIATGLLTVGSAAPVYAANDGRHARHEAAAQHRHDPAGSAGASSRSEQRKAGSATSARREPTSRRQSEGSQGRSNPPRHTPTTVCHRLGNGSFHLLTMDDSALKAHVGHGDIYPVPDGGCPAAATGAFSPGRGDKEAGGSTTPPAADVAPDEAVGVPGDALDRLDLADRVLGVQVERTANRAGVQVARGTAAAGAQAPAGAAPASGVLPQTGAGDLAMTMMAGLGLLVAGAGLLSRRRLSGSTS